MNDFLLGATAMASATVGLFFFRSWRVTADRLFAFFALAFWTFSLDRVALFWFAPGDETRHYFFMMRLAAYALIILAIIDKNRRR